MARAIELNRQIASHDSSRAKCHLDGICCPDFLTVDPYIGRQHFKLLVRIFRIWTVKTNISDHPTSLNWRRSSTHDVQRLSEFYLRALFRLQQNGSRCRASRKTSSDDDGDRPESPLIILNLLPRLEQQHAVSSLKLLHKPRCQASSGNKSMTDWFISSTESSPTPITSSTGGSRSGVTTKW